VKIAILTPTFFQHLGHEEKPERIIFGGAERYLVELCRWLQQEGHQVTVYQAAAGEQLLRREYAGIPIYGVPAEDTWELHTGPNLNQAFYELSLGADVRIYFATFLCWPVVRSPAISISHGVFWDYPAHGLRALGAENRQRFWERQFYGFTAVDACVAVDSNVRNVVAAMLPGEERKIRVVPNFVDTERFHPPVQRESERLRVLSPRRLNQLRGLNEFLLAARALPQLDFVACGQGFSVAAEEGLNHLADLPNLSGIWRPMEEMPEVYRQADIAVVPTRAAEGTSLSCLEAMATGLPVVATPAGGLPNLVIDRWNGLVVDLNHDGLAEAISTLAADPELRRKFGARNRQMTEECFNLDLWRERWRRVMDYVM
jgi:glycosyltransferase involved in cell wall biosynthesis